MPSSSKPGERRGRRQKGSLNKKTVALHEALEKAVGGINEGDSYYFWPRSTKIKSSRYRYAAAKGSRAVANG
jgi:hypothetical protein